MIGDDRGAEDHLASLIFQRHDLYNQRVEVQQKMLAPGIPDDDLYRYLAASKTIGNEIARVDKEIIAAEAALKRP